MNLGQIVFVEGREWQGESEECKKMRIYDKHLDDDIQIDYIDYKHYWNFQLPLPPSYIDFAKLHQYQPLLIFLYTRFSD